MKRKYIIHYIEQNSIHQYKDPNSWLYDISICCGDCLLVICVLTHQAGTFSQDEVVQKL